MLTQDEAELYDRQIRLWGVNAQSRLRQSKVLMLGFNGVASEVAKILVLAGIDTLTIVDDQTLQESDVTSNLFCRPPADGFRTHAVVEKLKKLNPLVKVVIDNSSILSKKPEELKGYDLVTLHQFMDINEISSLNDTCRENKIKFYLVLDYGFFGFMFSDLGPNYSITLNVSESASDVKIVEDSENEEPDSDRPSKRRRVDSPSKDLVTKVEQLPSATFKEMISLKNNNFDRQTSPVLIISVAMLKFYSKLKHTPSAESTSDVELLNQYITDLRQSLNIDDHVFKKLDPDWIENINGSLSPVCAVMGGVAGQDMIRTLSNKDIPINNTFSFDGITMSGIVERVGVRNEDNPKPKAVVKDILLIDDDD